MCDNRKHKPQTTGWRSRDLDLNCISASNWCLREGPTASLDLGFLIYKVRGLNQSPLKSQV